MQTDRLKHLHAEIASLKPVHQIGRVSAVSGGILQISGLADFARIGDRLRLMKPNGGYLEGEVLQLDHGHVTMLPDAFPEGVSLGDRVALLEANTLAPSFSWIGRIVDPYGRPLDGRPLLRGTTERPLRASPPPATRRRALGPRLETGMSVFNTMLPIVQGQRVGLFSGSGVGKSSLLAHMAKNMQADVVVIALIGERGRELRDFVENVLGPEGMKRSVVVAATSDQSPLARRRCAWAAMTVAEHFRDRGQQVLFLADSITRFAEAHREISVAAGEPAALRGFPASTSQLIMSLCERAGPGGESQGDITALLTVLVAGSDMEEPIADILRGVLDGHVVLDRQIAERGRYPAIDLLKSVSRSLPGAANDKENEQINQARRLLGAYEKSEMMIRAGLYTEGNDPELDRAVAAWPQLDGFIADIERGDTENSFAKLGLILRRAQTGSATMRTNTASAAPAGNIPKQGQGQRRAPRTLAAG